MKFKYKLAFVKECNKKYFWYKYEIPSLFKRHGMSEHYQKVAEVATSAWRPEEIFEVLERK